MIILVYVTPKLKCKMHHHPKNNIINFKLVVLIYNTIIDRQLTVTLNILYTFTKKKKKEI